MLYAFISINPRDVDVLACTLTESTVTKHLDFMALLDVVFSNGIKSPRDTLKVFLNVYQVPKTEHILF